MNKIAIVIPNHKKEISKEEQVSLEIAKKKFIKYDKFFLVPNTLQINFNPGNFVIKKIKDEYFSTYLKYNEYLINPEFYKNFSNYDYILIYQLDCLFFGEEKELGNYLNFDYVGSPHINIKKKRFSGIMNGGFSLRKINSSIDTLNSTKFSFLNFKFNQIRYFFNINRFLHFLKFLFKIFSVYFFNKIRMNKPYYFKEAFFSNFSTFYNEDVFWSIFVNLLNKDFRLPTFKNAMSFGFDKDPDKMFELNDKKLPLGCHCWFKDGNDKFWLKYL